MIECLEGLRDCVESARAFFPGAAISVSPITLCPRHSASTKGGKKHDGLSHDDPRQSSLFCAAWLAGALGVLQDAKVSSATFFAASGPGGLAAVNACRTIIWPVYHALADFLTDFDTTARVWRSSQPLVAGGWAHSRSATVANFTGQSRTILACGLPRIVRVRLLDDRSVVLARNRPDAFHSSDWTVTTERGRLPLRLSPFAQAHLIF